MFLVIKLFFTMVVLLLLMMIISGLSLVLRFRNHLRNPFMDQGAHSTPPPPGNGDIIEGEYKVLDEKGK